MSNWKTRSLARKSGICSARSALMTPTQVTRGKWSPLAIICVPTRMIDLALREIAERLRVGVLAAHVVGIHPRDARLGESVHQRLLDFFRAAAGVFVGREAALRDRRAARPLAKSQRWQRSLSARR